MGRNSAANEYLGYCIVVGHDLSHEDYRNSKIYKLFSLKKNNFVFRPIHIIDKYFKEV